MKEYIFTVEQKFNNYKAIDFLKSINISDQIIQKVKFGGVYHNDNLVQNINDRINAGDIIKIVLPTDTINPYITPIKGELKIVFEDEYVLAVAKERGILTHSSKSNNAISLEQLVCGYFAPQLFTFRPINRLDRDTTGIVIFAKSEYIQESLAMQMQDRTLIKEYRTIVEGILEGNGTIDKPIKRQEGSIMLREVDEDGERAVTHYEVLQNMNNMSLVKVILETGRTHQIRVHMSYIGHPVYNDPVYTNDKCSEFGQFLHSYSMEFIHPITKEHMYFERAIPEYFENHLKCLEEKN
jgi:23S rRNA pseudouridine1911/1915/1917 synthase